MPLISLTTDFGDLYPAAMKAVILGINPDARIVDITHSIPQVGVWQGAFALYSLVPYFPEGTVHVEVVDPGVGTLLISSEIPPNPRPSEEFCRHKKGGICLICVDRCPAGALRAGGLDKEKCFKQVRESGSAFPELKQVACGKCATGPCALRSR